nr:hypothetical protein [Tanacetum cinerariifolium]
LFDSSPKDSDGENPDTDGSSTKSKIDNQERPYDENSTKDINTVGPSINTAISNINTGSPTINTVRLSDDYFGANNDMRSLDGVELDISNLSTTYHVPTTLNTIIDKDYSLDNVIGDMQSGLQTRRMTVTTNEQGFISAIYEEKTHEFDRGYVAFGGGAKGGKIIGKGTIRTAILRLDPPLRAEHVSYLIAYHHTSNALDDSLYDIYLTFATAREIWESSEKKYRTQVACSKKFFVEKILNFKMNNAKPVVKQVEEIQIIVHEMMERRITPNIINTTSRKSIIVGSMGNQGTKLRIVATRKRMEAVWRKFQSSKPCGISKRVFWSY